MPVKIVTDSSADLTAEQIAAHDIRVVPLSIRFGDEEFTDGVDLTSEGFYEKMARSEMLPATAAPSPSGKPKTPASPRTASTSPSAKPC